MRTVSGSTDRDNKSGGVTLVCKKPSRYRFLFSFKKIPVNQEEVDGKNRKKTNCFHNIIV